MCFARQIDVVYNLRKSFCDMVIPMDAFNRFLDKVSEFFAHRKGLLVMLGMALVVLNFVVQFIPGWLGESNLLLHLGVLLGFFGVLLAWAL